MLKFPDKCLTSWLNGEILKQGLCVHGRWSDCSECRVWQRRRSTNNSEHELAPWYCFPLLAHVVSAVSVLVCAELCPVIRKKCHCKILPLRWPTRGVALMHTEISRDAAASTTPSAKRCNVASPNTATLSTPSNGSIDARLRAHLQQFPFQQRSAQECCAVLAQAVREMFDHLRANGRIHVVHTPEQMAEGMLTDPAQVNHTFDRVGLPELIARLHTLWLRRLGPGPQLEGIMQDWASNMTLEQLQHIKAARAARASQRLPKPARHSSNDVQAASKDPLGVDRRSVTRRASAKACRNFGATDDAAQRSAAVAEIQFELALGQVLQSQARAFTTHQTEPHIFLCKLGTRGSYTRSSDQVLSHDVVHEICHILSGECGGSKHVLFQCSMALDEGVTEYFAQQVCHHLNVPIVDGDGEDSQDASYERPTAFIRWLCRGVLDNSGTAQEVCAGINTEVFLGMEQAWYAAKFGGHQTIRSSIDTVVSILSTSLATQFTAAQSAALTLRHRLAAVKDFVTPSDEAARAAEHFLTSLGQFHAVPGTDTVRGMSVEGLVSDYRAPSCAVIFPVVRRAFRAFVDALESGAEAEVSDSDSVLVAQGGSQSQRTTPQNEPSFQSAARALSARLACLNARKPPPPSAQEIWTKAVHRLQMLVAAPPPDFGPAGLVWFKQLARQAGLWIDL